jgi:cytoskeletal protein CcmA (bactofilin family)
MFGGRKTQPSQSVSSSSSEPPAPVQQSQALTTNQRQPVGFETVLGTNTTVKGELKSKANVRIDGNLEGALEIEGNLLVGETARIVADIHAKNEVRIAGAVRGNVFGKKVFLARTGRVWGDINAVSLIADEGAFIDGKITMLGHPAGTQGFTSGALPAPEFSVLQPMAGDSAEDEPVEAELMPDDDSSHDKRDEK